MKELAVNLWETLADLRALTTNGFVAKGGRAVMGRGCAREAREMIPGIDYRLGGLLREHGNRPMRLCRFRGADLASFPVKHHWREADDPDLISRSAHQLVALVERFSYSSVAILARSNLDSMPGKAGASMEKMDAGSDMNTVADAGAGENVQETLALAGSADPPTPDAGSAAGLRRCADAARGSQSLAPELSPRERLLSAGPEALSSAELLGVLFGTGANGKDALDLAGYVISEGGGLSGLSRACYHDLLELRGMGKARACALLAAVELGRRLVTARDPGRPVIASPADVHALLGARLAHLDREHFVVCLLDAKNRVSGSPTVSIGTLSSSLVHPREVFKPAIKASAASLILAHNHPSGDARPSREDREVTKRLVEAAKTIGIEVLDHVIVGDGYFSLKEHGML